MQTSLIEEVRFLSQDHGFYDHEIAQRLGVHRVTIVRCRKQNNIPRPNLKNRRDKIQTCKRCGDVQAIRRSDRIRKYCDSCKEIILDERRAEKRRRWRAKSKKHSEGMLPNVQKEVK